MRIWRSIFLALLLVGAVAHCAVAQTVTWQPLKLTNGSPVLFRVTSSPTTQSVSAEWLGHKVIFFHPRNKKAWFALAGVPLQTPPGTYTFHLTETSESGAPRIIHKQIRVLAAKYTRIPIKVAKQFTEPGPAQLTAIGADKEIKEKIFAEVTSEKLWAGPFRVPVEAPVSDLFGTERVFNQEVQSRHQGLDYAVPAGTPVRAINRGVVVLARPMFFEGDFIVVDHGQGLLSLYLHLSDFKVKEGDEVTAGQVIALSGGSGRATGAHLHLAIRWQGVYLDPAKLLGLPIPTA